MPSLILAAGEQTRWEKDHFVRFKQLLPVCGEPVLHRTVRQVLEREGSPIIVTHLEKLRDSNALCFDPPERKWTVETFWSTSIYWHGRVEILLGDTAYSKETMDRILTCEEPIRVFGNEYEIYAISFLASGDIKWLMLKALEEARNHAMNDGGKGTLRMFYEAFCGFELGSGKLDSTILDRVCWVFDYTKDFDTPNDYTTFLNRWERKGLVDDLP